MKRVALLVALLAVSTARADVAPPVGKGKKLVPVTTVVEVTEDFPDYAFFELSWSSTPGPPPHGGNSRSVTLHFFAPGTTIKATGARRSGGALYAVPVATVMERVPDWKGFADDAAKKSPTKHSTVSNSDEKWFALARAVNAGEVPGATSIPFGTTEEVPVGDSREAVTAEYRVARTPAGVAFVRPGETMPRLPSEGDPSLAPRDAFPWKWVAAGGSAFAALVLGGVWAAWRFSRRA